MTLFFNSGFGGFELKVLLFLNEFCDIAAQFLECFLLLSCLFELINFIGELLFSFFESINGSLLGVGGVLGLGKFILGLLHLARSLTQ